MNVLKSGYKRGARIEDMRRPEYSNLCTEIQREFTYQWCDTESSQRRYRK